MKKVLAVLMAMVLSMAALAGCGSDKEESKAPETQAEAGETKADDAGETAADAGETKAEGGSEASGDPIRIAA